MPTPELWIHHTADENHGPAGVRAIQRYHMDVKGWDDIAYSFLVDDDGSIYEGRGFGVAGGHTAGHNNHSHAICFMGNFQNRQPTAAAMEAARWLFHEGRRLGKWKVISGGHRDAEGASTACPGKYLYARLNDIAAPPSPGPTPKPAPQNPSNGVCEVQVPMLKRGDARKGAVRSLQTLLNAKASQGLKVDGDFGPATEKAVKNVQAFFRLRVDGIVGSETWGVLFL